MPEPEEVEEDESRWRSRAERADARLRREAHRLARRAGAVPLPLLPVELLVPGEGEGEGKGRLRPVALVQLAAGKEKRSVPACVSLREPEKSAEEEGREASVVNRWKLKATSMSVEGLGGGERGREGVGEDMRIYNQKSLQCSVHTEET